jgi:hypothetical protein
MHAGHVAGGRIPGAFERGEKTVMGWMLKRGPGRPGRLVAALVAALMGGGVVDGEAAGPAQPGPGTCAAYDFSAASREGKLQWVGLARVLRNEAPLYAGATDSKPVATLAFNQRLELLAEQGNRVQVRETVRTAAPGSLPESAARTGWMLKGDLLCRNMPLQDSNGLEKKFFIRTASMARDAGEKEPGVRLYQNPELLTECASRAGSCQDSASRFHMYFVVDERDNSVLLADRYRLDDEDPLVGWASRHHGFSWNNGFGLRPRIAQPGTTETVCSYEKLESAVAQDVNACSPISGGAEWFRSALRIPVLELVDARGRHVAPDELSEQSGQRRFYKVALSRPGLVARQVGEGRIAISSALAERIMPELKGITEKKNVDIFFLLDATASMQSAIDAVRGTAERPGVIQEIIEHLKSVPAFRETQFRFGFRVYRDPYADPLILGVVGDGVGEGVPLGGACQLSPEEQLANAGQFQQGLAGVQATHEDQDDYEENLYGGLEQVLGRDIVSCPDHLKLLFIIGDSGYDARAGAPIRKYARELGIEQVGELLRGGSKIGSKQNNVIPFFIQTPMETAQIKHPEVYRSAYMKFDAQARQLLRQSLPADVRVDEHFFRMGEDRLVARLVSTVQRFGGSSLIDDIILDIRGGEKLSTIIDRLRREHVDIPGIYWHILNKGACGDLGNQCEKQIFDTTLTAYIEADDRVVEELWTPSGALSSWSRILKGFEGYYDLPEPQLRRALISAMILGLQQEIRRPPIDVAGETPADYAQKRGGLPVRRHSPLLSYPVASLSAEQVVRDKATQRLLVADMDNKPLLDAHRKPIPAVPACELRRLSLWAIQSRQMLEIVERDFQRPVYRTEAYSDESCPDATPNGRMIPRIVGPIDQEALGPDRNYRFGHTFGGQRGFWIPQEYLP